MADGSRCKLHTASLRDRIPPTSEQTINTVLLKLSNESKPAGSTVVDMVNDDRDNGDDDRAPDESLYSIGQ